MLSLPIINAYVTAVTKNYGDYDEGPDIDNGLDSPEAVWKGVIGAVLDFQVRRYVLESGINYLDEIVLTIPAGSFELENNDVITVIRKSPTATPEDYRVVSWREAPAPGQVGHFEVVLQQV